MQRVAYIDHYDSFTANLIDWLLESPRPIELEVVAFDDAEKMAWLNRATLPLVFSPGPKSPHEARASLALLQNKLGIAPIFGVCLGHQMLGVVLGGVIERSRHAFHGEDRPIFVRDQNGFLKGLPSEFRVGVYHSLIVNPERLNPDAVVSAIDAFGECQVLEYRPAKAWHALGVQFHPESFLTSDVSQIRERWLDTVFS